MGSRCCNSCVVCNKTESLFKCYKCGDISCLDCGFDWGDGEIGCGICDREEYCWIQFDDAIDKIQKMRKPNMHNEIQIALKKLVKEMKKWRNAVENNEEEIVCKFYE